MSEKVGLLYTNQEKLAQSYTFCRKKGASHIPGSADKGGDNLNEMSNPDV